MSQLEDMRIFAETVDAQSFTAAADRMGLSKQFVSKRVAALEKRLGARLLVRSTRQLRVTDLGLAYHERAQRILEEVDAAEQLIASQTAAPRGLLRLSAPMTFATLHLGAVIAAFMQRMDASYREQLQDIVVLASQDGDRAAAEYVVHGEYLRDDEGLPPARGQAYVLPGGAFFDIRDDRIARVSNYYNLQDWIAQVSA